MADFGQNTRPLSPVDFKHNDSRTTSLFFPTSLIDEQNGNKPENKNGVCEDCIEDSSKSKGNSTQQPGSLGQKKLGFTGENSMFHDFPTSTTFWSPASIDDAFVQTGIPPVNGVHFSSNTQMLGSPRRPLTAPAITTTISQQPRRPLQNSSQYIGGQTKPVPNINSLASGWNGNQAVSGWPHQQPSTTWGRNYSSPNNTIINRNSRPSSLSFPQSSRYRNNGGSRPSYNGNSRHGISAQTITQGLQSLNLNGQHPIDGTILDNITGLGNSHGPNNELSNSFYSHQVSSVKMFFFISAHFVSCLKSIYFWGDCSVNGGFTVIK